MNQINRQANQQRNVRNQTLRTVCAGAAIFATLTVVASIDVLARHYGVVAQVTSLDKPVAVASN